MRHGAEMGNPQGRLTATGVADHSQLQAVELQLLTSEMPKPTAGQGSIIGKFALMRTFNPVVPLPDEMDEGLIFQQGEVSPPITFICLHEGHPLGSSVPCMYYEAVPQC